MTDHVSMQVGDQTPKRAGMKKVEIAKQFRRVILLVLVLYALSSFQMTVIVNRLMSIWLQ